MAFSDRYTIIVEAIGKGFTNVQKNIKAMNNAFGMSMPNFRKIHDSSGKLNKQFSEQGTFLGRLALRMRMATHGLRGFKMEMLGVMFFGLGMKRFFEGLITPALELTGIMDLFRLTLQMLFLPIAMALLPIIMDITFWIMNWSEETKLMVGKLVIFGIVIGTLLFLFGMFALGVGSMIQALGWLFDIIDNLIPDVTVLGVNFSSFIEAGLGISIVTGLAGLLGSALDTVVQKLVGLDFVSGLLDKLGIKVQGNISAWELFKQFFGGLFDKVKAQLGLETGMGKWLTDLETKVNEWIANFKTEMGKLGFTEAIDSIKDIGKAVEKLTPSIKTLADALDLMVKPLKWLVEHPKMIALISGAVGGAVIGGRAGGPTGAGIGAVVGATAGNIFNIYFNPTTNVEGGITTDRAGSITEMLKRIFDGWVADLIAKAIIPG